MVRSWTGSPSEFTSANFQLSCEGREIRIKNFQHGKSVQSRLVVSFDRN
ncbi:hypothetical protein AREALGSMS7_03234 [Arenibacter algicola]|uniref:Uncharacterized protein n=1 Tax=Arenibacter algicola TaxID=616991 RepID=A0A221UZ71_9FLAO|nr:hypothetical protein AREALGSMS7_03234 [Arenibacter algicola]